MRQLELPDVRVDAWKARAIRCELPATHWSTGTERGMIGARSIDTGWPWWRPATPWKETTDERQ